MQGNTLDCKWQQTDENTALYKCNLCSRAFITNHGRNIHLSSCRKKFSLEDLTTRPQNSQQDQDQMNVNITAGSKITSSSIQPKLWGDHTLKMISITRSMWYTRKSLSGDGIYSNFLVREKKLSQKLQSRSNFGTKMWTSTKTLHWKC